MSKINELITEHKKLKELEYCIEKIDKYLNLKSINLYVEMNVGSMYDIFLDKKKFEGCGHQKTIQKILKLLKRTAQIEVLRIKNKLEKFENCI